MKSWRQSQILEVIDHEPVASQEALRKMLQIRGIGETQATISRDLKELGLVKRAGDGAYVRPGSDRSSPAISEQLRRAVSTLLRAIERAGALRLDPRAARRVHDPHRARPRRAWRLAGVCAFTARRTHSRTVGHGGNRKNP